ncbi:MAG TPA: hypothetical protein VN687_03195 [Blastocatellia bacterium]|nr:hypothetical protein [Blastocatellia bacterium]
MSNYFDTPGILGEWDSLKSYVQANTPDQMLSDIRYSTIDPNDLLALGDLIKMVTDDEALNTRACHTRKAFVELTPILTFLRKMPTSSMQNGTSSPAVSTSGMASSRLLN